VDPTGHQGVDITDHRESGATVTPHPAYGISYARHNDAFDLVAARNRPCGVKAIGAASRVWTADPALARLSKHLDPSIQRPASVPNQASGSESAPGVPG
jgi:hypothetical protein